MKLYTEEQVREIYFKGVHNGRMQIEGKCSDEINSLTHIELPSDEEIEKFANEYVKNKWEYAQDENKESFVECAKWMRDKIKGGDK